MLGETASLFVVNFPLVAHHFATLGSERRLHGGESAEAREAKSDDENFAHFQFPVFCIAFVVALSWFADPFVSTFLFARGALAH